MIVSAQGVPICIHSVLNEGDCALNVGQIDAICKIAASLQQVHSVKYTK
jgi:hypothetical protein